MAGRKPLPTQLKIIKGTAQKCRMPRAEPQVTPGIPPKPEGLSESAAETWDDLSERLFRLGVLAPDDAMALSALCEAWAEWQDATTSFREAGYPAVNEKGGRSGESNHLEACHANLRRWLTEFGLTPSSRSRVSVIERPKESKWAAL